MSYTLRNLLIAALLGFVGIILTTSYIKGQRASLSAGKKEVTVWVATKDIPAGTRASSLQDGGYLKEESMLREDRPPRSISDVDDVEKLALAETVFAGEVLTANNFATNSGLDPTEQIQGNIRLFSVPLTPPGRVADLIRPGDHVDIIAYNGEERMTYFAARDVVVEQTPDSLISSEEESEAAPLAAKADPELYVLRASDEVAQRLINAYYTGEDEVQLWPILRGSNGPQQTDLPPIVGVPKNSN